MRCVNLWHRVKNSIDLGEIMKLTDFSGIKYNEPMSVHTTFRAGGPADMLFEPETAEELLKVLEAAKAENVPVTVIGNGSNLLVRDGGVRGLVVKLAKKFSKVETNGEYITAQSGALMSAVANAALQSELGGLEFASGIPGTIGGGLYMNAGAYGGELSQVVEAAEYVADDMIKTITKDNMNLGYRHSIFGENGGIITAVRMKLYKDSRENILEKMTDFKQRRIEKQPLEFPSAGSTFKRPQGHFAGALIEAAGLKGKNIGGAEVSQKHAGFIINRGGAKSADILALIEYVKKTVFENSGVMLEPEVRIIGEE